MSRPVWARINLNALRHNVLRVRTLAPGASIIGVVKANAYGHDSTRVAQAIEDTVDAFAVAGIGESDELIAAGITRNIILLTGFHEIEELPQISEQGLIPVIHSRHQIEQLASAALPKPVKVWVKFDSGMHRIGIRPVEIAKAVERLKCLPHVTLAGLMSHLACADERKSVSTNVQIELFENTTARYGYARSLANSAGICAWPRSHVDWVRPGIMMYGCSPMLGEDETETGLRPVMSLYSKIIAINRLKRGDRVGYGGQWCCPEDMPVGIVACGYGDGYPRHAPSGTPVWINGFRAAVVGRVSMDVIMVDLRGLDGVDVGDVVELWGENVSATEVAACAATISYEILSGVTARVPRIFVRDG